jgi:hypothetical protein
LIAEDPTCVRHLLAPDVLATNARSLVR